MAVVEDKGVVIVEARATITFDEKELRALEAMTGYGVDPFLAVFYEKLGESYMRPYEAGLRSLFSTVRGPVTDAIRKTDDVRRALRRDMEAQQKRAREYRNV